MSDQHTLIVGITMSGKSTLARMMQAEYEARGIPGAIYSPVEPAEKWPGSWPVFDEFHQFANYVATMEDGGVLIIDEGDTCLSMGHRENWIFGTRIRHYGFKSIILTQRPALISPTVRGQCADCYTFTISDKDAKLLADDYAAPELKDAPKLRQGHFLRRFWHNGRIVVIDGKVWWAQ